MKKKILFIFILLLACQLINLSTIFAAFEDIGIGARATGMGNIGTSLADNIYSLYYNPAGLGQIKQREFTSSFGRLYWGLDDGSALGSGFLGLVYPFNEKIGTLGFGWINFHLTDYYSENTFLFSYGRKFGKKLYTGLNLKILNKQYGIDDYTRQDPVFIAAGYSKSGISTDLGLLYRLPHAFNFGFTLTDFIQPDMGLGSASIVPLGIKFGLSHRSSSLGMAVEFSYRDGEIRTSTGGEKWFLNNSFAVRTGLGIGSKNYCNFTLGTSYVYSLLCFDYAFIFPLSGLSDIYGTHRIGLTFRFGPLAKGEITDTAVLQKKINDLEKQVQELEKTKSKTDEELTKTKTELEKLKKEKSAPPPAVTPPPAVPTRRQPLPVETPSQPTIKTHKVLEGETLQAIALKYYGDEKRWVDIYNANKDKIERGIVKPGQILIIP